MAPPPDHPVILIDAAHHNGHTLATTYGDLAERLREDGWIVHANHQPFTPSALAGVGLLVVSNALAERNLRSWREPIDDAFTPDEVEAVRRYVSDGGALLLVADHMPFPAAAVSLSAAFGVRLLNGFAYDTALLSLPSPCLDPEQVHVFRRADGTLLSHPITEGRTPEERVDSVATFTGQALDPDGVLEPLLRFGSGAVSVQPVEAWTFDGDTTVLAVEGWLQGGVMDYGAGRVAVLGEAAMFTAQTCRPGGGGAEHPMGWNAPAAQQNLQFARNLVRWLMGG